MDRSSLPQAPALSSAAEALERLRPMLAGRLLLASDFDGTISCLTLDLWSSTVLPAAQRALRRLAGTPGTHVAFISGRTAADLAGRIRVGGASYHGDHGAETAHAARGFRPARLRVVHEPVDPDVQALVDRLKTEVPRRVPAPWLALEDKGSAVTFHFRRAPDVEAARAQVRAAIDAVDREGLLAQPGGVRMWELRPPGAMTKQRTLAALIARQRPDLVIMLGDDRHDLAAFDGLRALRQRDHLDGLAIGVLSRASDPDDLARRADVVFGGAHVSARFLTLLSRARATTR